jgi:hypothetical protein
MKVRLGGIEAVKLHAGRLDRHLDFAGPGHVIELLMPFSL